MFVNRLTKIASVSTVLIFASLPKPGCSGEICADSKTKKSPIKEASRPVARDDVPFARKILFIKFSKSEQKSAVIDNIRIRKLGDCFFIGGRAIDVGKDNWSAGRLVWYPLNSVEMIAEFDTIEEVKKIEPGRYFYAPLSPPSKK